jgi:hypothetical protein
MVSLGLVLGENNIDLRLQKTKITFLPGNTFCPELPTEHSRQRSHKAWRLFSWMSFKAPLLSYICIKIPDMLYFYWKY